MNALAPAKEIPATLFDALTATPESSELPVCPRNSLWLGGLTVSVGLFALWGWLTNDHRFLKGHPYSSEMSLRTALDFVLLGTCFSCYFKVPRPSHWAMLFRISGVLGLAICAGNAVDLVHLFTVTAQSLGFHLTYIPWAIQIAIDPFILYVLIIVNLGCLFWPQVLTLSSASRSCISMSILVSFVGMLVIVLGYVYHAPFDMLHSSRPVPFLSTVGCGFLSLSLIMSLGSDSWPLKPFHGQKTQARLLRTFLPLASLSVVTYAILSQYVFAFLNPAICSIIAIISSTLIGGVVISHASHVVSREIDEVSSNLTNQFIELVDSLKVHMMYMLGPDGRVMTWTEAGERLKGYRAEEIIGKDYSIFFTPEDVSSGLPAATLRQAMDEGMVVREGWRVRKDGTRFRADVAISVIKDAQGNVKGFANVVRDVTDKWQHEQLLEASLKEKELLLKEIHHRVKNNLQIVTSLLRMQSRKVTDPNLLQYFRESQSRVQAMALIHEYLYQSRDLSNIDLQVYLRNVVSSLLRSYGVRPEEIVSEVEAPDINVHLDLASPCGLIVTELVTNSMKYAFPNKRLGKVTVRCHAFSPGMLRLVVGDNGVGLPESFNWASQQTLGLQLVKSLARQLNAEVTIVSSYGKGTQFTMEFKGPIEKENHV